MTPATLAIASRIRLSQIKPQRNRKMIPNLWHIGEDRRPGSVRRCQIDTRPSAQPRTAPAAPEHARAIGVFWPKILRFTLICVLSARRGARFPRSRLPGSRYSPAKGR